MKINLTITMLLATIMAGTAVADRQIEAAVSLNDTLKPIEITCPDYITVGPVNLQSGWKSTGVFPMNHLGMEIQLAGPSTRQQVVKCWYGDGKHPMTLSHQVPTSYSCKTSTTDKKTAVCKVLWK